MTSKKQQCPKWVVVAAHEFTKMIRHLELRSIHQAAKALHVNYRTLVKLDETNPDPSIKIETLMSIWHSLEIYASGVQSPDRAFEESLLLGESMMCIIRTFPVSPRLSDQASESISRHTDRMKNQNR